LEFRGWQSLRETTDGQLSTFPQIMRGVKSRSKMDGALEETRATPPEAEKALGLKDQ